MKQQQSLSVSTAARHGALASGALRRRKAYSFRRVTRCPGAGDWRRGVGLPRHGAELKIASLFVRFLKYNGVLVMC